MIFHIAKTDEWKSSYDKQEYIPHDYEKEGFIHCSYARQLNDVITRYYKNEKAVYILSIDEKMLLPELRIEHSDSINDDFPHIYGPLNKDSVVSFEKRIIKEG